MVDAFRSIAAMNKTPQIVQVRINPRNPSKSSVVEFDRLELNGGHYVR
jgi:hypothetical protein